MALIDQYFNWEYLTYPETINWALENMKKGNKFLFIMNVLLYTDYRKWSINQIRYNIVYKKLKKALLLDPLTLLPLVK